MQYHHVSYPELVKFCIEAYKGYGFNETEAKQITDVLDMLAEDTSIPRNIRKGATDAKTRLLDTKEAMDVRATSAIVILDDLANDPNIPLHGRTLIWNVISQLEVMSQQN